VVDLGPLLEPSRHAEGELDKLVRDFAEACARHGFFIVTNHGISEELLRGLEDDMATFFHSPQEEKRRIKRTANNSRGFADDELTKQRQDWKELLDVGHKPFPSLADDHPSNVVMDGHNQWPEGHPGLRAKAERYYVEAAALAGRLMEAVALGLGLPREYFRPHFREHTSYMRMNYYPAYGGEDPSQLCISRHTDAGALTVLRQGDVESLQVYTGSKEDNGDGQWQTVPSIPGALTINTGDMLQVWSNSLYKAAEHRVLVNTGKERFSYTLFYNPDYTTNVAPFASAEPAKYTAINYGEFRRKRFEGDFADVGTEVQIEHYASSFAAEL